VEEITLGIGSRIGPDVHDPRERAFDLLAVLERVSEDFGEQSAPSLSGITLDGRLAVVYSRFDLGNGWEQFPHPYTYSYSDKDALAIGTNVIVTAVTH